MTTTEIVKIKNKYDKWSHTTVWPLEPSSIGYMIWMSVHNAHIQLIFNKERFRIEEFF